MKRKLFAILLCVVILAAVIPGVLAASDLPRVVDDAALMSQSQRSALEDKAEQLRNEYEMDVVILTVDSLNGKRPQDYADDYYGENGYGCGDEHSGLLFLLAMEERDWYISTCGNAIYALTDYGIQQVGEAALPYLSSGEYYEAFTVFLDALPVYFTAYQNAAPVDGYADTSGDYYHGDQEDVVYYEEEVTPSLLLALMTGAIVAGIAVLIMRLCMNTKRLQSGASDYLKAGSFRIGRQQDLFLYSNVSKTRRPKETNNGGGGGGSSVHTSSSGNSHGGGGGKF